MSRIPPPNDTTLKREAKGGAGRLKIGECSAGQVQSSWSSRFHLLWAKVVTPETRNSALRRSLSGRNWAIAAPPSPSSSELAQHSLGRPPSRHFPHSLAFLASLCATAVIRPRSLLDMRRAAPRARPSPAPPAFPLSEEPLLTESNSL